MNIKNGYCTTTYKFGIYCENSQWLYITKEIYNHVLEFYYEILSKEPELLRIPKQKLLRNLEILTIGIKGQDIKDVKYPLPYKKIPLYFRRAAINDAARLFRSSKTRNEKNDSIFPKNFNSSPIFYKGMYKDFTETGICLKLWNGEKWIWTECCLDTYKRKMPDVDKRLSPMLKLGGKKAMLHVPVLQEIQDVSTVEERLVKEDKICAISFPGNDCMAVLAVMNKNGEYKDSLFIRGGNQWKHEKRKLLNRIEKNRASMGGKPLPENENKHLKAKIRNLSETYAHRVSRQIVDFCESREINIVVVPNYKQSININALGYLPFTNYDWLGRRIIKYLRYKAFEKGKVVTTVTTKHIASTCYICGQSIKKYNKNNAPGHNYFGGKNYICPGGHKGNANFNSAMNIGYRFLKSQAEMQG